MIRLAVAAEGQTEEAFVKRVLAPYLMRDAVDATPILIQSGGGRGGDVTVEKLAKNMANLLWSFDAVTSLVDFYGFRGKGSRNVDQLEAAVRCSVLERARNNLNGSRLIPYIQMHEFEALLFTDAAKFHAANVPDVPENAIAALGRVRRLFSSPEEINDSPRTAPSKQIAEALPKYKKVLHGVLIAEAIGIEALRSACPRFRAWLDCLQSLGKV